MTEEIVADLALLIERNGEKNKCSIRLEKPQQNSFGIWSCRTHLTWIFPKYFDIKGDDSLQSLSLAISFIGTMLITAIAKGDMFFYDTPEQETFDFDSYVFSSK